MKDGKVKSTCMDSDEIERALTRMAHQILEANHGAGNIALVGIVTRGDLLAMKLAEATVVGELFGEHPVLLLDDVLSELDDERQT